MKPFPSLFSPFCIGKGRLLVQNRIVMAPMLVGYGNTDGTVSDELIEYYAARARGGAGMIIVEAACVDSPEGRETFSQLNIDHPCYVAGLERLAQSINAFGCRSIIQLFHAGRQTFSAITGSQPVAPSSIACPMIKEMPRQLTIEEIKTIENKFITAAHYAHMAGFDGVEIHAAHGYLINQFLSAHSNKRDDEYGGSLDNRMKILLNIVKGIRKLIPEMVISVRLNIDDFVTGGLSFGETYKISLELEHTGADLIHCSCGTYESGLNSIEPASYEEGWRVYLAREVKNWVHIPIITGGVIKSPELADKIIREKQADFVFMGRSLLADSEWPDKARHGREEDIRPCIMCNHCIDSNFKGLTVSCTVNPVTGRENQLNYCIDKSINKQKHVVIAGSGPAGMQAALSLEKHGFNVSLYEKEERLGGLLNLACIPPHKERVGLLRDYMVSQIKKSQVQVFLNQPFDLDALTFEKADYLVIATGSKPVIPKIKGWNSDFCVGLSDVLNCKIRIENKRVVIVGGGTNGCEAADFLLGYDNQICIVEEQDFLAPGMEKKNRRDLINRLERGWVKKSTASKITEIKPGAVRISNKLGEKHWLEVDYVICAAGFVPANDLFMDVQARHPDVYIIGDAFEVRGFKNAFLQGELLAYQLSRK